MMKDPTHPNVAVDSESEAVQERTSRPSGQERQEQYRRTREHAASGQDEQDRDARIRRRAHEIWEREGQPNGLAEQHWNLAANELDQEDAKTKQQGVDAAKPNTRNPESDRT